MSAKFQPGDLVTGCLAHRRVSGAPILTMIASKVNDSRLGWNLLVPRHSIMTVVELPMAPNQAGSLHPHITVLINGELLNVFVEDIEHLTGEEQ